MSGTFEGVTRMALEEIVIENSKQSKFGYVLSEEGMQVLVDKLHEFFMVSRNMRSMGEKVLQGRATLPRPGRR